MAARIPLSGQISFKAWPAFSLYVRKMGWDLALGGMGITVGSFIRLFTQQDAWNERDKPPMTLAGLVMTK